MKRIHGGIACSALLLVLAACGGGSPPEAKTPKEKTEAAAPKPVSAEAQKGYNDALQIMGGHDKANDWNDATCAQVAKLFIDASSTQKSEMKRDLPEAV